MKVRGAFLAASLVPAALLMIGTAAKAAHFIVQEGGAREPAFIVIWGRLNEGDAETFREKVQTFASAVVFLNGPGGSLPTATGIGRIIRQKRFATAVPPQGRCLSACAIVWLAGNPRRMGNDAYIGFHQPHIRTTNGEPSLYGMRLVACVSSSRVIEFGSAPRR